MPIKGVIKGVIIMCPIIFTFICLVYGGIIILSAETIVELLVIGLGGAYVGFIAFLGRFAYG
jgi:hypothetical protein